MLLTTSLLILLLIISVAAFVMLRQKETFSDYGSPGEAGNLLLSKIPDVCSDLGQRTDCINTMGCGWNEATGMCQREHSEGFSLQTRVSSLSQLTASEGFTVTAPACSTYTDCATCAAADDCGWCKTTGKCLEQDRFGTSAGQCIPEGNFSTAPSTCSPVMNPNFDISASELLGGSASGSASASSPGPAPEPAIPITVSNTPKTRAECERLVNSPMPPVTDPALRRLHNETVAQCLTLLSGSSQSASASASAPIPPPNPANIQVQFQMEDVPSVGARIRQDIERLMRSIGI